RLRARYGRSWRRKAPVEALMPLKLTRYGVPLHRTAPRATALPEPEPIPIADPDAVPGPVAGQDVADREPAPHQTAHGTGTEPAHEHVPTPEPEPAPEPAPVPESAPTPEAVQLTKAVPVPEAAPAPEADTAAESVPPTTEFPVPVSPGRYRTLAVPTPAREQELFIEPAPLRPEAEAEPEPEPEPEAGYADPPEYTDAPGYADAPDLGDEPVGVPDGVPREEFYFSAYREYVASHGEFPTARLLSRTLYEGFGVTSADGNLLSETYLGGYMREFKDRYNTEMGLAG
ncbi:hypothetical protein ACFW4P_37255, partial [Streptomyces smyrnaeus]